jgi:two-component system sensor histidine kinase KdpD
MTMERRPDPDALLARVEQEERNPSRGRLKIFFGAVAGVGKTYAMLEAAQERLAQGVDVVVGYVETHGRPDTATLLTGLTVLPPRQVPYRGRVLREFDLDAALSRKPQLLLVDELAHTNAPGSRHARRFHDVEELLRAGIDVYTTLNVQHLESLNDLVAQITGVAVRETVPDSVLESASEVELVDLPADELLLRLREGKVYVPEQAERALANFFKKGNLIALRELALRCTADRVDAQMQVYRRAEDPDHTWPITEKVLVCISPSPSAMRVVRAGRRLARRLRAAWTVLYVEQPRHLALSQPDRDFAAQALRLAEQLGGETVTLAAHDAVDEILDYARERNFSKIVVGKPGRFWRLRELFTGTFVGRLAQQSGDIDVFLIHGDDEQKTERRASKAPRQYAWAPYAWATATVGTSTAFAALVQSALDLSSLIMVHFVAVVASALRWGRGPALLAALLSVAAVDFFFAPPRFTLVVSDSKFFVTFTVMLLVAVVISTLAARAKEQVVLARKREHRTNTLYSLSRELASTRSLDEMISVVRNHVQETLGGQLAIFIQGEGPRVEVRLASAPEFASDPKEVAVAQWVHEHAEVAGRGTETLAGARGMYLPLVGSRGAVGVLGVLFDPQHGLPDTDQMHLLQTIANQAALALERALLAREAHRQRLAAEGEKLRNTLLAAVSHDLKTPLAAISGAASSLASGFERLAPEARKELILTLHEESQRMNRLATNLLDMGRLQSRNVPLVREWQPLEEVCGAALEQLDVQLREREVILRVPDDLPLVWIDEVLIERVLVNLLENAVRYTPAGSPIELSASASPREVLIEVLDRGPGLAPGEESQIFDRFVRGGAATSRHGAGLGLAISRAIVEAHDGRIWAENRAGGGAAFRFTLPRSGSVPPAPPEEPGPSGASA